MATREPKVEQPTEAQQREYLSLRDNDPTIVTIGGTNKTYKIRWLRNGQIEKLGRILLHKKKTDNDDSHDMDVIDEMTEDAKIACKVSAVYILDGFLKLKFFYWFLWRWFYYVKEYRTIQLEEILQVGKKKIPLTQFFITTMFLTEASDTLMMMTMSEAERILQEQNMARNSSTASSSSGSSSHDTSSSG